MLPRNQIMSAQTANAIMMQQQQQQRRLQGVHHRGTGHHPGGASGRIPTVIPHNSANVEAQLLCNYSQYLCRREKLSGHDTVQDIFWKKKMLHISHAIFNMLEYIHSVDVQDQL